MLSHSSTYKLFAGALKLMRPKQWVKNLLVLCPMFFSGNAADAVAWSASVRSFILFCVAASAVYCFNDACDCENDRRHPRKCRRPVASGEVGVGQAYALSALLGVAAVIVSVVWLPLACAVILGGYMLLNVLYSRWLKHRPILDVVIVAFCYVIRLVMGDCATGCHLSHWIVIVTFMGALLLAVGKRRAELLVAEETGDGMIRKTLSGYTLGYADVVLSVVASSTFMCYLMYTISADVVSVTGNDYVFYTSFVVLAAILRYLHIVIVRRKGGNPSELLFRDWPLALCAAVWIISFVWILY